MIVGIHGSYQGTIPLPTFCLTAAAKAARFPAILAVNTSPSATDGIQFSDRILVHRDPRAGCAI
jgi:hypothetical protein